MNYVELSLNDVYEKTEDLYNMITSKYDFDLVIFVAKGAYVIGEKISSLHGVPLLEIFATRKGGKLKKIFKPILSCLPKKMLIGLRKIEMNSNYHDKNNSRNVSFEQKKYSKYVNKKRILLVDDSIDSGYSILEAKKVISEYFKDADIKVAVFNCMNKSCLKPDYCLYKNMMINGPWSNDSKYYNDFMKKYLNWRSNDEK